MFCGDCGTQLPDDAAFCGKCGKAQKAGVVVAEPRWNIRDNEQIRGSGEIYLQPSNVPSEPMPTSDSDTDNFVKTMAILIVLGIIYICSPVDPLPEAVLGPVGVVDDIVVAGGTGTAGLLLILRLITKK
jgi:hypothetical protein